MGRLRAQRFHFGYPRNYQDVSGKVNGRETCICGRMWMSCPYVFFFFLTIEFMIWYEESSLFFARHQDFGPRQSCRNPWYHVASLSWRWRAATLGLPLHGQGLNVALPERDRNWAPNPVTMSMHPPTVPRHVVEARAFPKQACSERKHVKLRELEVEVCCEHHANIRFYVNES